MIDRKNLLRYILASGTDGRSIREVMARYKANNATAGYALRMLGRDGRIEPTHPKGGVANRWGAPGTTAKWRPIVEANYRRRKADRDRWRAEKERKAILAAEDELAMTEFEKPPIKRVVDARAAEPLLIAGPASVWHYASAIGAATWRKHDHDDRSPA